jgi:solute carrier family 26 (sodium-independent sulfate anion transporter), member 11
MKYSPSVVWPAIKEDFRTDHTWNRVFSLGRRGARATPEAAKYYVLDKFPVIGWLPKYNYRWIISDIIAGLTLGIMLIPQSLAYAKLADM